MAFPLTPPANVDDPRYLTELAIKNIVMSIAEQEELLDDICNDVLGYGPLEPLLSRDDISDIMVNGAGTVFIEVAGRIQRTGIRFRDNQPNHFRWCIIDSEFLDRIRVENPQKIFV